MLQKPTRGALKYWPLLLIAACIILFSLDSVLLYNDVTPDQPIQELSIIKSNNDEYQNNEGTNQRQLNGDPNDPNDPEHGTVPVQPRYNPERRKMIIERLTWALKPENRKITLIVNSCGRLDLLNETITSFEKYYDHKNYPLHEMIIIDDSRKEEVAHEIIKRYYPRYQIIFTANNEFEKKYTHRDERITYAMDKLYSQVTTPWIYHIEDDWRFMRGGFINEAFDIFETGIPAQYQTGSKYVLPKSGIYMVRLRA